MEEVLGREAYVYELERTWGTGWICRRGVRKAGRGRGEIETDTVDSDSHELYTDVRFSGVDNMQRDDLKVGGVYCRGSGCFLLSRLVEVGESLYVLDRLFRGKMIERNDVFGGKGVQAIALVVGDDGNNAV